MDDVVVEVEDIIKKLNCDCDECRAGGDAE